MRGKRGSTDTVKNGDLPILLQFLVLKNAFQNLRDAIGAPLLDLLRCRASAPMSEWWRARYPRMDYRCQFPRLHPFRHHVALRLMLDDGQVMSFVRDW